MHRPILIAVTLALCPIPVSAAPPSDCPAKVDMPEPWLTWASPISAKAGQDVASAVPAPLGRAVEATLAPIAHIQYAVAPDRAPVADSYGGLLRVNIAYASRIGIALSGAAWVDLIEDGAPLPSADHGHGDPCTGIRKIVWFDVKPGAHILEVANAPGATIRVMAAELSGQY